MTGWVLGLGFAIVSFFARYYWPAMPRAVAAAGMIIGGMIVSSEVVESSWKPQPVVLLLLAISIISAALAIHLYVSRDVTSPPQTLPKRQLDIVPPAPTSPQLKLESPPEIGPITWNLDGQFIVASGGAPSAVVNAIILRGTSNALTTFKEAYVVSMLTGGKQDLLANIQHEGRYHDVTKVDIPPSAPVHLDMVLQPPLSINEFMEKWGKVRVFIRYGDGQSFAHEFDENYVRRKIQDHYPNAFGPRVTPRN